jgi:hypothetical protein
MQNRDAPAYQEYAAATLAKIAFRLMTLEARGLFYTMRLECWVNRRLPAMPVDLAIVLGVHEDAVTRSLPSIMPFFRSDGEIIECPELEDYRDHLSDRKRKQVEGGKLGAERKKAGNSLRKTRKESDGEGIPTSNLKVPLKVSPRSLVQHSTVQHSPKQLTGEGFNPENEHWLDEYNGTTDS